MTDKYIQIPKSLALIIIGALLSLSAGLAWNNIDYRIDAVNKKNTEQDTDIVRNQEAIERTLKELQRMSYAVFPPEKNINSY